MQYRDYNIDDGYDDNSVARSFYHEKLLTKKKDVNDFEIKTSRDISNWYGTSGNNEKKITSSGNLSIEANIIDNINVSISHLPSK